MRPALTIVLITVGIFALLLISVPLQVHSAGNEHSSSNSSTERVFKHVSPETESVAYLSLAIISVLIALLALIGDRKGVQYFYDTYPCPAWLNQATWGGRAINKVLRQFSARNCIVYILFLSIFSPFVCFVGYLRPDQAAILLVLDRFVEGTMFIAIGFFLHVLLRAFVFCLS